METKTLDKCLSIYEAATNHHSPIKWFIIKFNTVKEDDTFMETCSEIYNINKLTIRKCFYKYPQEQRFKINILCINHKNIKMFKWMYSVDFAKVIIPQFIPYDLILSSKKKRILKEESPNITMIKPIFDSDDEQNIIFGKEVMTSYTNHVVLFFFARKVNKVKSYI